MRIFATAVLFGALVFGAPVAHAHPQGFHQHVRVVVHPERVEVLVVLDVDSGKRSQLLRAGADVNADGRLDAAELERLRARMVTLATSKLKLTLSGFRPPLRPVENKLNLRDQRTVGTEGLSVAVLLEAALPETVREGMTLEVEAASPDRSHVRVEGEQVIEGGKSASATRDLKPGERFSLRLNAPRSL